MPCSVSVSPGDQHGIRHALLTARKAACHQRVRTSADLSALPAVGPSALAAAVREAAPSEWPLQAAVPVAEAEACSPAAVVRVADQGAGPSPVVEAAELAPLAPQEGAVRRPAAAGVPAAIAAAALSGSEAAGP